MRFGGGDYKKTAAPNVSSLVPETVADAAPEETAAPAAFPVPGSRTFPPM